MYSVCRRSSDKREKRGWREGRREEEIVIRERRGRVQEDDMKGDETEDNQKHYKHITCTGCTCKVRNRTTQTKFAETTFRKASRDNSGAYKGVLRGGFSLRKPLELINIH